MDSSEEMEELSWLFSHKYTQTVVHLRDPCLNPASSQRVKSSYCEKFHSRDSKKLLDEGSEYFLECHHEPKGLSLAVSSSMSATTDYDETGLILWPASILLASVLLWLMDEIEECSLAMELGSGSGLGAVTATTLMKAGTNVLVTDGNEKVIDLLKNHLLPNRSKIDRGVTLDVHELLWKNVYSNEDHLRLNTSPNSMDLIIGADITHWAAASEQLANTIYEFLSPLGIVIITGVLRAENTYEHISTAIIDRGLYMHEVKRKDNRNLEDMIKNDINPYIKQDCRDELYLWIVAKDSNVLKRFEERFKIVD